MKYKGVSKLLKDLNDGQGEAIISCLWDSATGEPKFDILVYRERDGEILERKKPSEDLFLKILASAARKP